MIKVDRIFNYNFYNIGQKLRKYNLNFAHYQRHIFPVKYLQIRDTTDTIGYKRTFAVYIF